MDVFQFFTDPLLRAPTIGSMGMCLSASLLGGFLFVRKQSLVGETLSHATYPGVTLAVVLATLFRQEEYLGLFILFFAFCSALCGFWMIHLLTRKLKVSNDAALCFVLAAFFGIGLTMASKVQFTHTHAFRQIQSFLYGQTATMNDLHIFLYFGFSLLVILFLLMFYKELQSIAFDRHFALSIREGIWVVEALYHILLACSIVIGIRTVGVVLMSAMLIAPAAAARQFTNRLSLLFCFAGIIGILSGFLGNYLSYTLSEKYAPLFPEGRASFATGPTIAIVAAFIAFISLLFAPERGLLLRYFRVACFCFKRREENFLKSLWRLSSSETGKIDRCALFSIQHLSSFSCWLLLFLFQSRGWIDSPSRGVYRLTKKGQKEGERIVRLHRLWETYLVMHLEEGVERVHHSAEEMEHILTPEMEEQLTQLLDNPLCDPHAQPIPPHNEAMQHG